VDCARLSNHPKFGPFHPARKLPADPAQLRAGERLGERGCTLPGRAEPLAAQPWALPNLPLKQQPQTGCRKGGKKTGFDAWLRFKAVEDITAVQPLAAWFKGNQSKPVPGAFTSICSLACAPHRGTGETESGAASDGCLYPTSGCPCPAGVPVTGATHARLRSKWQGFPAHPTHTQPWLQLGKSTPSRSPSPRLPCRFPAEDGER